MYSKAHETARLYQFLSEKLGNDTTAAMFKYIDNKAERSVENAIQALPTKNDLAIVRKEINESKVKAIKWMLIFWVGQVGVTAAIIMLLLKK
jgi:hypothetical protein